VMMTTTTLMCVLFMLGMSFAPSHVAAEEDNTFMQFAYIRDATVDASSVVHVVEDTSACAMMTSKDAAYENNCHAEAKRVCEALGDDCGGFVIEPADINDAEAKGIVVKVYAPGAKLFSLKGGIIFEYRGLVGNAAQETSEMIAQHIDEQHLAEEIQAALDGDADLAAIEAAIKAFLEDEDEDSSKTDEEGEALVAQLSEMKRKTMQKAADKVYEKAGGFIGLGFGKHRSLPLLHPRVTCSRGELLSPKSVSAPVYRPYRAPIVQLGTCSEKQVVGEFGCTCTEGSYIPKSCTPASFTPGVAPTFTPGSKEFIRYQPGSCSVQFVNKQLGVFGP